MAKKKSAKGSTRPSSSQKRKGIPRQPKASAQSAGVKPSLKTVERPADFPGIRELVFVDAATLSDHPDNWKTHTQRQLKALDAEFDTVGWVLPLAFNLRTGRLLDGHGRKKTDWVRKHKIVPVVVGDWPPEQEDQILLHLDPIGGMFETEGGKYRALMDRYKSQIDETLDGVSETHRKSIENINDSLDIQQESIEYGAPASFLPDYTLFEEDSIHSGSKGDLDEIDIEKSDPNLPGMYDLKLFEELPFDCFGRGGEFDIPALRPDMLADIPSSLQNWVGPETPEADAYFYIYGCAAIEKVRSNKLIVAYYTYDHKFESIWSDPRKFTARMINFKIHSVITPNFSAWAGCPFWFDIYQTARSRWLGRYWQETGKLKVIPDITLPNLRDDNRLKMRLTGLPKELPAISIQLQQKGEAKPEAVYLNAQVHLLRVLSHIHPEKILLYHGPDLPKDWTLPILKKVKEIVHVKSWMWERGKVLKEKTYLSSGKEKADV